MALGFKTFASSFWNLVWMMGMVDDEYVLMLSFSLVLYGRVRAKF